MVLNDWKEKDGEEKLCCARLESKVRKEKMQ